MEGFKEISKSSSVRSQSILYEMVYIEEVKFNSLSLFTSTLLRSVTTVTHWNGLSCGIWIRLHKLRQACKVSAV